MSKRDETAPADGGPERTRVLVSVRVMEGEDVSPGAVELVAAVPVVLAGVHAVPDQTAPGQARMQFGETAQRKLDEMVEAFEEVGGEVETRLLFTADVRESLERVADEEGCGAILLTNPAMHAESLLVAVRGSQGIENIARVVGDVVRGRDIDVTLFHVLVGPDADGDAADRLLADAADALTEQGVSSDRIQKQVQTGDEPVAAIATAANDYDAVVMGEGERTWRTVIFGRESERIAERSVGPVLLVRHDWMREIEGSGDDGPEQGEE